MFQVNMNQRRGDTICKKKKIEPEDLLKQSVQGEVSAFVIYSGHNEFFVIKGIVQRKLRWVKIGIK
jgi:hypothetical protein